MSAQETSADEDTPAIVGENTADGGDGIVGKGSRAGVAGQSEAGVGVYGHSGPESESGLGLFEHSGLGVLGSSNTGTGVAGFSESSTGVHGKSNSGFAIFGEGDSGPGVVGTSTKWIGVYGETAGIENGPAGVWGEHKGAGFGVRAVSKDGIGLAAHSDGNEAVHAETKSGGTAAIAAFNLNPDGTGAAIFAKKEGSKGHAGFFGGNVHVTGDITTDGDITLLNADCAEDFDIADPASVEPGTVMVLGEEGVLHRSQQAYDKRVAGVLSGAGDYKPGIVLDKQQAKGNRKPVALLGKVYCKADASYAPIEVGDLLTTSPTLGHAMKAADPLRAFGAVIGKALRSLREGQALIPILIALQ